MINFPILQNWFCENHMILNSGKCYYMVLGGHTQIDYTILNGLKVKVAETKHY